MLIKAILFNLTIFCQCRHLAKSVCHLPINGGITAALKLQNSLNDVIDLQQLTYNKEQIL
jgi:hypothetical protein